ncbi:hypothetical protein [Rhodococcoides fascians]|uniref:hypothetical protein n=1 Tax=Rhodococcoides fascians TaxID=1828 RepID=UPI00050C68BA|nr:hypothetical protein [Rhodococcus fascians]
MTVTEEQLTNLRLLSEFGLSPHKAHVLLDYVDGVRDRVRIAENMAAQSRIPLEALRGVAADHRRNVLDDRQFAASVHYWLDA